MAGLIRSKSYSFEVYALLWVTNESETVIRDFFCSECKIPEGTVQRGLHLTIYHGRRALPGLVAGTRSVQVIADINETRFMVLAPGGENPRPELQPKKRSIGIRLTKRNTAIDQIQELRKNIYRFETPEIIGNRTPTSAWRNCFGARCYQPHVKLLRPGSRVDRDLRKLGKEFRSAIDQIEFGKFEIKSGPLDSWQSSDL